MRKQLISFLLAGVLIAGCSDVRPLSYEQPILTYEHEEKHPIPVAQLTMFDHYQPPMTEDHVDHLMVNNPKEVLKKYFQHKIYPADNDGEFKVTILDASVIVRELAQVDEWVGWFNINPSKEYRANLLVQIDYEPDASIRKTFTIKAEKATAISNYASVIAREQAQFELIEGLMQGFDARFEEVLKAL